MPEQNKKKIWTLYALNHRIGNRLKQSFPESYWVTAEISEMTVNSNGHCYLELIEKEHEAEPIIARSRAIIWAYTFRMLRPYFETTTGRPLSPGIKIMILAEITFHEVYGLSLIVKDIEPGFTIGDMALRRQKIIRQLKEEGIFDMNRRLTLPMVPQDIAIISSEKAAGLQDFIRHLSGDSHHYRFCWKLFPAMMQGKEAEPTIINALEEINIRSDDFDVVVIIRGGGARTDLSAFDQYRLAAHIAQFPLPVITGIGHEKDESVTDLVARTNLKTPTAVAQFLIDRIEEFEIRMLETITAINELVHRNLVLQQQDLKKAAYFLQTAIIHKISDAERILHQHHYHFRVSIAQYLRNKMQKINQLRTEIKQTTPAGIHITQEHLISLKTKFHYIVNLNLEGQKHRTELLQKSIDLLNPANTLKRGYSITRRNNKVIRQAVSLRPGDILITEFEKGKKKSKVI
ncbi:MAG: exodeoxyribonuclease VII large subunit [Chlorobi bacterium]|nr:exodeoxyribonuclease VII large subunit [Chlorobiota bacterium]